MVKCASCGKFLASKGGATCTGTGCQNRFHLACLLLPEQLQVGGDWLCPECRKKVPKSMGGPSNVRDGDRSALPSAVQASASSTPVAVVGSASSAAAASSVAAPAAAARGGMVDSPVAMPQTKVSRVEPAAKVLSRAGSEQGTDGDTSSLETQLTLREEIRLFRSELREVREFRREMSGLHASLGVCSERIDKLETRIEDLETRQSTALPDARVSQLEQMVTRLQTELDDREQDLLSSDMEIANIPEVPGENVLHIVGLVAAKLGVALDERDIVFAQRVGLKSDRETRSSGAESPTGGLGVVQARARRIVVRLTRRGLRDELLKSARVRRGATTADLGLPAPSRRFFLNERLTRKNRQLFHRVRGAGNRLGWKYTWTKFGRVLAKQGEGKPTHCIRTEDDLSRVFGLEAPADYQE